MTKFTISCAAEQLLRSVLTDDIMTLLLKKVLNIDQNSRSPTDMKSVWSVSKLSTESVGSRRELVANYVYTVDADATQLDSCASCRRSRCVLGITEQLDVHTGCCCC